MADIPKRRGPVEAWCVERAWEIETQFGAVLYSPQYSDDEYVYRHINVTRKNMKRCKELLHQFHAGYKRDHNSRSSCPLASKDGSSLLPYEDVVQRLHIHMSNDWILYLIHE
eukprot:Blabericola_migrator_1__7573@NODE_386_length_9117_cov_178_340884_g309_i0_p6_GENE_NODE_386_length_9117_cov_178_340884_g309_i0NODE_386_length_9117_cov_178_340884_g309_i0_p6_ORF_typecomplete_len112_score16_54CKS/PF01111_19/1_6e10_NODE_386_length_9117_cov_178_340884_g309_i060376372